MAEEKNEDQDFKDVVGKMVETLKKSGLNVSGAAVMQLDGNVNDEQIEQALGDSLKKVYGKSSNKIVNVPTTSTNDQSNIMDKMSQFISETVKMNEEISNNKEICYCPNCFNFNTFEEVLSRIPGGVFSYTEFTVAGKEFIVKYWKHAEKDREQMMIEAKEDYVASESELQEALKVALSRKDYEAVALVTKRLQEIQNETKKV